jgi:hypothetical protein
MKVLPPLLVFTLSVILSIVLLFVAGMLLEWMNGAYFPRKFTVAKVSFKRLNTASSPYQSSELLSECCSDLSSMETIELALDKLPEVIVSGWVDRHRDSTLDFTDLSVYINNNTDAVWVMLPNTARLQPEGESATCVCPYPEWLGKGTTACPAASAYELLDFKVAGYNSATFSIILHDTTNNRHIQCEYLLKIK